MKTKKLKRLSFINLIGGYVLSVLFILLVLWNRPEALAPVVELEVAEEELFNGTIGPEKEFVYIEKPTISTLVDRDIGIDHGLGVVLKDDPDIIVLQDRGVAVVDNPNHVVVGRNDDFIVSRNNILRGGNLNHETIVGHPVGVRDDGLYDVDVHRRDHRDDVVHREHRFAAEGGVDLGALEKAMEEADHEKKKEEFRIEKESSTALTLAKDKKGDFTQKTVDPLEPYAAPNRGNSGDLYAYNFPSRGVGAGIGSPAIGAGVGSSGLGAGIGEAILDGKAVPALGGVGTKGAALSPYGGVGGLVGGAGAGGAAGLTTALAKNRLGLGIGEDGGAGIGVGSRSERPVYNLDDLPANGSLHIMMHVDGSGSILNTRKELEVMKDTLLKTALLPYYNNDEDLYNRRVTIVDGQGERTLQFFREAARKDNVLAFVFQDEAQPAYHLPNFNRFPEDQYLTDLNSLKGSLEGYTGVYRGIMLQVDRGRTFAKSFKEFVENSWQGKGYLAKDNLKKYYWEENKHHIENKDGIVFSDVYHVKDEENAQYYLDLIFQSANKVGLNLDIRDGGLVDGKYIKNRP